MTGTPIEDFLAQTPWSSSKATPLAGDASARRYLRLHGGPRQALVMIAPPESCGPIAPFVAMTAHLRGIGLRAPEIFAEDAAQGLVLLEDFGDAHLARLTTEHPDREPSLYAGATDVLIALNAAPVPVVQEVGPAQLAAMLEPLFTHYAPQFPHGDAVMARLEACLSALPTWQPTLALRDYHAENLISLGDGPGTRDIGLLDYQDAVLTHPTYDLASLLQDARRRIPETLEARMIGRFQSGTGLTDDSFQAGYRLVALQRNLRILGIFARLAKERPGARYAAFQPIVWHHVQRMLRTPDCASLAPLLAALPAPEATP